MRSLKKYQIFHFVCNSFFCYSVIGFAEWTALPPLPVETIIAPTPTMTTIAAAIEQTERPQFVPQIGAGGSHELQADVEGCSQSHGSQLQDEQFL